MGVDRLAIGWLDVVVFVAFFAAVVSISLYASRREKTTEDYFLAGRNLGWWLIGFSLIASNISTEHFVGMSGQAFGEIGLAVASYEWMAAVTLILVGWFLLPRFLKAGIFTMPEYLEYRYDAGARTIMAVFLMVLYILALLATVLYSGSLLLNTVFDFPGILEQRFGMEQADAVWWARVISIWLIGLIAASYTIYGGLKAVVWSDLIQGAALLLGGVLVLYLTMTAIGGGDFFAGWTEFREENAAKLSAIKPADHPVMPWPAVFIWGLWIPNLFYWGLNQFITQRALAARSVNEAQKGILFAAFLKLIIPFIVIFPAIGAYQLYGEEIAALGDDDQAYPYLIVEILPWYFRGIMLAALAGAVMSTFNSGLNSAATIFTIDLYRKYLNPNASQRAEITIGRIASAVIVVLACLWAPVIFGFPGVFHYIQEIWGFISPGIVAVFLVGLLVPRTPAIAAKAAMILGLFLYGFSRFGQNLWFLFGSREDATGEIVATVPPWAEAAHQTMLSFHGWPFLHHMGLIFGILVVFMLLVRLLRPLPAPRVLPVSKIDTRVNKSVYVIGALIILIVVELYVIFQ